MTKGEVCLTDIKDKQIKIRVLIVDDSAIIRNVVSHIVNSSPNLEIWDKAINGRYALEKLQRAVANPEVLGLPDVIVSDIEMPEMNGLEFLKKKKEAGIKIPVVVLSSLTSSGAFVTMEALNLGACDFVQKPTDGSRGMQQVAEQLRSLLEKYGESYRNTACTHKSLKDDLSLGGGSYSTITSRGSQRLPKTPIGIVVIGVSTGGPYALRRILKVLPDNFSVPILIVQHMPMGFTEEFARGLDKVCALEVREAKQGDIIKVGRVLIAPGGKQMKVEKRALACVISITDEPPQNSHKPSVGKLFESVAKVYGSRALALIMTGMGNDGSQEIGKIYNLGGITIGQNEASCVVYGMPKVAEQYGFLDYILNLDNIAPKIMELINYSNHL